MTVHEGHRERLRKQLYENGLESFSEVQKLELMLGYVIARKDTNPIAHDLLEKFGSLAGVLDADPAQLRQVDGIGETAAAFLHVLPQLLREYEKSRNQSKARLTSPRAVADYLEPYFLARTDEVLYMVCLNSYGYAVDTYCLSGGDVNTVQFTARSVAERALNRKAASVILAHNHVAGNPEPSREDLQATKSVQAALETVGVHLADHLIFLGGHRYTSFLERGLL